MASLIILQPPQKTAMHTARITTWSILTFPISGVCQILHNLSIDEPCTFLELPAFFLGAAEAEMCKASMIKRKFGDSFRSKTEVAAKNEVLAKLLAHNLTVMIMEMHCLGIEPEAWGDDNASSATLPMVRPA